MRIVEQDELPPIPPPDMQRVCHVLLQVRDDTAEDISRNVSEVIELLVREGAVIEGILSSIVAAVFPLKPAADGMEIEAALGRLGPNVRAAYQNGEHMRGMFGSPARMTYGTLVPDMSTMLEALLHSEFGTATRLDR